jgi:hypothetical protein
VPVPDEPKLEEVPGVLDVPGPGEPGVSSLALPEGMPAAVQPRFTGFSFWPLVVDVLLVEDVPLLLALPVPLVPDVPVPELSDELVVPVLLEPVVLPVLLPDVAPGLGEPPVPEAPPAAPPLAPAAPPPAPPAPPPPPPPPPAAKATVVPAAKTAAAKMAISLRGEVSGICRYPCFGGVEFQLTATASVP